ncbi:MAG: phosphotransferase [Clostridia bacterium]|nr:phosphotransferase [Clostridia bacterium]
MDDKIKEIIEAFPFEGELVEITPINEGLINTTLKAEFTEKSYIIQKINTNVFKNPDELMANISAVTSFVSKKLKADGKDAERGTLNFLKTKSGEPYFKNSDGESWRSYVYIDDCYTISGKCTNAEIREAARGFGEFQHYLKDFDGSTLFETIKDFHLTPQRYQNLCNAVEKDIVGRAAEVKEEIDFLLNLKDESSIVADLLKSGELPVRVTHNDTKYNNVLFDNESKKAICVIDLDTIMPGSALYDFGDGVRTSAATTVEDDPDTSKMGIDEDVYTAYVEGFLEGTDGSLTKKEIELLPFSVKLLTAEVAMRFLTDYLEGDTYFKISNPQHNLQRTRAQIQLIKDIDKKMEKLQQITARAAGSEIL